MLCIFYNWMIEIKIFSLPTWKFGLKRGVAENKCTPLWIKCDIDIKLIDNHIYHQNTKKVPKDKLVWKRSICSYTMCIYRFYNKYYIGVRFFVLFLVVRWESMWNNFSTCGAPSELETYVRMVLFCETARDIDAELHLILN